MDKWLYSGHCRCGATDVLLRSSMEPSEFLPRSDSSVCEFCMRHDGIWISDPEGGLELSPESRTLIRRNGRGIVEFHFCARCDELAYAVDRIALAGRPVAIARLRIFPDIVSEILGIKRVDFREETAEAGGQRRSRTWTPAVFGLE
jgi:hypothetical protein